MFLTIAFELTPKAIFEVDCELCLIVRQRALSHFVQVKCLHVDNQGLLLISRNNLGIRRFFGFLVSRFNLKGKLNHLSGILVIHSLLSHLLVKIYLFKCLLQKLPLRLSHLFIIIALRLESKPL